MGRPRGLVFLDNIPAILKSYFIHDRPDKQKIPKRHAFENIKFTLNLAVFYSHIIRPDRNPDHESTPHFHHLL